MRKIAFLSMDDLTHFVSDDLLAEPFLQELGWEVDLVSWRNQSVVWEHYEAVIIRTTWDYQDDLPSFLTALAQIESKTCLANPLEVVRWNADKKYLRELESKGINIVPTRWGESISSEDEILQMFVELDSREIVVKPNVSANADSTFRLTLDSSLISEAVRAFANREYMVQPFMDRIIDEGEYSLFYLNGEYSHAILKTPKAHDFRVQEEHGGLIQPYVPTEQQLLVGANVMRLAPPDLLYARVDLVRDTNDDFALMELELVEPALYLRMSENAPALFANAVDNFLDRRLSLS